MRISLLIFFELDAASNNSVDDIRSLNEQVRIPPQVGTHKIYIIDEVHMLSIGAFNAFLKTLEEPQNMLFLSWPLQRNKKSSQQYYLDVKPMILKELVLRIAKHT